jgi:hypothetical protein
LPPARPAVFSPPMNLVKAVIFTLISSLLIAAMSALVFIGAGIVAGAGLFVIFCERQLGLRREREAEGPVG